MYGNFSRIRPIHALWTAAITCPHACPSSGSVNLTKSMCHIQSIVRELLAARSAGGVERRLLLPVYNLISTQPVRDNVTSGLDLSAIHQVHIVRSNRSTMHKVTFNGV